MKLCSIKFSELVGEEREWVLDELTIKDKNLIVGRNSTGKTRVLNVIGNIAKQIAGLRPLGSGGEVRCVFRTDDHIDYEYGFSCKNGEVVSETLSVDGKVKLARGSGGYGEIFAEKINGGMMVSFQVPPSSLAVVNRRDALQHSFIEPLYQWGATSRHYHFGSHLGKETIAVIGSNAVAVDDRDEDAVVAIFRDAQKEFGDPFVRAIIEDMAVVGYDIEDIGTCAPLTIVLQGLPGEPATLYVKEKGLLSRVDQLSMSQGMYRALALLVHLNYVKFKRSSSFVLVDDIGEGLDFERSCSLINLLRSKADSLDLQLVMSTNDRFVMNEVPLEEWTVLHRKGSRVSVSNYDNSKDKFDEFKFTGLSNFSFFEMDFLSEE